MARGAGQLFSVRNRWHTPRRWQRPTRSFHACLFKRVPVRSWVQKATEECQVLPQCCHLVSGLGKLLHHLGASRSLLLVELAVIRPGSLRLGLRSPPLVGSPDACRTDGCSDSHARLPSLQGHTTTFDRFFAPHRARRPRMSQ